SGPSAVVRPRLFFFSSRRRHTRFSRDWSSDVCSSDLRTLQPAIRNINAILPQLRGGFQGVAAAISGLAGRITGAFRAEGIAPFNRILGSTSTLINRVGQFLEPVIGAMLRFGAASAQALVNLSGGMANAGQRFADFIDKFANVQTIQRWLQNAGTAFRQLGAVLKNLG